MSNSQTHMCSMFKSLMTSFDTGWFKRILLTVHSKPYIQHISMALVTSQGWNAIFWGETTTSTAPEFSGPEFQKAPWNQEKTSQNPQNRTNWWVAWNITFTPRIQFSSRDRTVGLMVRVQNIPSKRRRRSDSREKNKTTNLPHTIQVWYAYICLNFDGECRQI